MQFEIVSFKFLESLKKHYETDEYILERSINLEILPNQDYTLYLETGETFANPDNKRINWEEEKRISCIIELRENIDELRIAKDNDLSGMHLTYYPKDRYGSDKESILLGSIESKKLIRSIAKNLRGNIKPKLLNISFEYNKFLSHSDYLWDNTNSPCLEFEEISIDYSI